MPVRRGRKGKQSTSKPAFDSVEAASPWNSTASDAPAQVAVLTASSEDDDVLKQLVLTSDKRRGVYECDYCGTDISQTPRIRCSVCVPEFDLCCDCFLGPVKKQTHPHDPATHGYRVCDSTRYPLFPVVNTNTSTPALFSKTKKKQSNDSVVGTISNSMDVVEDVITSNDKNTEVVNVSDDGNAMEGVELYEKPKESTEDVSKLENDETGALPASDGNDTAVTAPTAIVLGDDAKSLLWTAEEDLRLLCGIQTHGLGNWSDISEAVAGQGSQGKTPKRCMERYFDDFMGRYGYILPPYTLISEASTLGGVTTEDTTTDEDVIESSAAAAAAASEALPEGSALSLEAATPTKDTPSPTPGDVTAPSESLRSSKRRSTMVRAASLAGGVASSGKRYIAVPTESLPEYPQLNPFLPILDSGPVLLGQEVGRDASTKAEQVYVRTIASLDSSEQVERVRKDWEQNRLNQPGGPTVLPMRPDDIPRLPGSELAGFMPRRGDFDVEYDNAAEDAIADMEFVAGESEQDRALKLSVLAIYNSKLDEREKRKQFILSRRLYDYRSYQEAYKKLPRDERDLVLRMRLFERFHTPDEHRVFIQGLLKAKRLRKEIAKLQMYHRMGIRTLLEAERYELDKARRLFHKNALEEKATMQLTAASSSVALAASAVGATTDTTKAMSSTEEMADFSSSSLYWKQYRTTDRKVRRSVNRSSAASSDVLTGDNAVLTSSMPSITVGADESAICDKEEPTKINVDSMDVEKPFDVEEEAVVSGDTQAVESFMKDGQDDTTKSALDRENLTVLPGYSLLSSREVDLIRSIQITPEQYLQIKKALISESLMLGLLDDESNEVANTKTPDSRKTSPTAPNTLVMLDVERRGAIVDFVVRAGWVPTDFGKTIVGGIDSSGGSDVLPMPS